MVVVDNISFDCAAFLRDCISHGDIHIRVGAEVDSLIVDKIGVVGHLPKLLWPGIIVWGTFAEILYLEG